MSPGRKPEYLLCLINQAVIRLLMLYFYLSQTCIIPPLRVAACRIYNRTPERDRERAPLFFFSLIFKAEKKNTTTSADLFEEELDVFHTC